MSRADKATIGSGPSGDPDRARPHRYGDNLDADIRAAMRGSRAARSPRRDATEESSLSEIRRNLRAQATNERC